MLARIVHDDPLRVREHVARRLRADAYLLDADRIHLRALALVARHAARYHGRPELGAWLDAIAGEAVEACLAEDLECLRQPGAQAAAHDHGTAFQALARPLGLEPEAMGRACQAFNRLASAERQAFFALVIHGRTLDELARESGESATEIARRARRALDTILHVPAAPSPAAPGAPGVPGALAHPSTCRSGADSEAASPAATRSDPTRSDSAPDDDPKADPKDDPKFDPKFKTEGSR